MLKVQHIIVLLVCVAILAGSILFQSNGSDVFIFGYKWPMRCVLHHYFGLKCALCGLTRSFSAIGHGQIKEAFAEHILGPAIFIFISLQLPYRIWGIIIAPKRIEPKLIKLNIAAAGVLFAAIIVNWLIYLGGLFL